MDWIGDWLEQVWTLLLTLGWWSVTGLLLCCAAAYLLPSQGKPADRWRDILLAVAGGAVLPMCNFAAAPLTAFILRRGQGRGTALAFLASATLLNPACCLLAYAYMGPLLATAYICGSVSLAFLLGAVGGGCPGSEGAWKEPPDRRLPTVLKDTLWSFGTELAFWLLLGILAEAALLALAPAQLWQQVMLSPENASLLTSAEMGLFRHVCVPDDILLAASLAASGLKPGCVILLLLLGVCTNLPELFVLRGFAGRRTAALYAAAAIAGSVIVAAAVQMAVGSGFVPQYNLAGADAYARLAELLSIRTWMPARVPCALALLLLAGCGIWRRVNKRVF